jgi:hypothetical protein
MKNTIKYAIGGALGTAFYVVAIALFMFFIGRRLSGVADSVFAPIAMLMLLVFSVAFVGVLVFGRPVMWYLDGKKKEALSLLGWTLFIFLILTIVAVMILAG